MPCGLVPKKSKTGGKPGKPGNPTLKTILLDFIAKQEKFNAEQEKNWVEQRKFNASIMSRLDNIVKLNNLKE